ncbi:MAG: UvrD-helicase domain-containing protein [Tannerellaceae bacterium]|jgi:ATP-dependent exoDNAse (exonuclease V) beta subunit|nr:UvrD-helicase domain-containing protein [Tannerellaceae bacterium]
MLTVYRASAGAGKTYKLTGEYLKLLFAGEMAYRRILAVTFTNKATDEMKGRIVEELHHLASGRKSTYVQLLQDTYGWDEAFIRKQAKKILITVLHDYASFNVSTIDRFFQQTMRAFTREIGLQGGYGIEMDQELVLTEAIDNLLGDLDKPESKDLLGWLLRFAEDKIESGGEWNLRRDIMGLSREVFKESYRAYGDEVNKDIADKQALENYKNELYAIIRSTENEIKRIGAKGMDILKQYALQPADFKGGSNSPLKHFEKYAAGEMKEPSATFINLADQVEACYTKTTPPGKAQIIACAFEDGLNECIKKAVSFFNGLTAYHTAKEIVRFYYVLGILNDVSAKIADYREEKNILLIADTAELLNKVIDGSDAPFIYEKTGTHTDHYMIDEFQDTSQMQWNNFRPLIRESLAHNNRNLIVGDVKQSIYRFRNSDWKLLDEQVSEDFTREQVREETLAENWRSFRHIVEFNNALFDTLPGILQSTYNEALQTSSLPEEEQGRFRRKIISAYGGSSQLIPPAFRDKDGHVKIEFLPDGEDTGWKEEALLRLPAALEQLQDNGYALKDIAILTRTNLEAAMAADTLLTYKEEHPSGRYRYDIISDEALFVNSSQAVRFLAVLLRHLKNPDEPSGKRIAIFSWLVLAGRIHEAASVTDFPPSVKKELYALSHQSLYEQTEGLFRLFAAYFPANEQAFIQAFFDMALEYAQKESADLNRFLAWWDETGCRRAIATPDGQNAARILTVHKSKGLGFRAVIIPFGDWEIDHKPTKQVVIWCKPRQAPFNKLRLTPVRYGQKLAKTIFAGDYFEERLHACIDNLNTLYVAFTRAKEELIVFAPRPRQIRPQTGKTEKAGSMASLLWEGLRESGQTWEGLRESGHFSFDTEAGLFELGSPCLPAGKEKEKQTEEISMGTLFSVSPDGRLQLRLHGKSLFFDNPRRKHGALMHEVLSSIHTGKDVAPAVDRYLQAGVVNREEASALAGRLDNLLASPGVSSWYDGSSRVLNEVEILSGDGKTKRPDRVMLTGSHAVIVDYKFGDKQDKRHHYQVKNYMNLVRRMGYENVEGFLWYVELDKIEAVNG